jgi:hypothetical protein
VKSILRLVGACLLIFVLSGCGKGDDQKPVAEGSSMVCAGNLRVLDAAKRHWVEDHNAGLNDTPTMEDLQPYTRHGIGKCPSGGTYTIGKVGELPQCSIPAHTDYFKEHMGQGSAPAPAAAP